MATKEWFERFGWLPGVSYAHLLIEIAHRNKSNQPISILYSDCISKTIKIKETYKGFVHYLKEDSGTKSE